MVKFRSHWRGVLQWVTQGNLWSPLLPLPTLWLCSLLLPLILHPSLGTGSAAEQGESSAMLMAEESTMLVGAETALPHCSPRAVYPLCSEQEENSLCRPSGKSHRQDLPAQSWEHQAGSASTLQLLARGSSGSPPLGRNSWTTPAFPHFWSPHTRPPTYTTEMVKENYLSITCLFACIKEITCKTYDLKPSAMPLQKKKEASKKGTLLMYSPLTCKMKP